MRSGARDVQVDAGELVAAHVRGNDALAVEDLVEDVALTLEAGLDDEEVDEEIDEEETEDK